MDTTPADTPIDEAAPDAQAEKPAPPTKKKVRKKRKGGKATPAKSTAPKTGTSKSGPSKSGPSKSGDAKSGEAKASKPATKEPAPKDSGEKNRKLEKPEPVVEDLPQGAPAEPLSFDEGQLWKDEDRMLAQLQRASDWDCDRIMEEARREVARLRVLRDETTKSIKNRTRARLSAGHSGAPDPGPWLPMEEKDDTLARYYLDLLRRYQDRPNPTAADRTPESEEDISTRVEKQVKKGQPKEGKSDAPNTPEAPPVATPSIVRAGIGAEAGAKESSFPKAPPPPRLRELPPGTASVVIDGQRLPTPVASGLKKPQSAKGAKSSTGDAQKSGKPQIPVTQTRDEAINPRQALKKAEADLKANPGNPDCFCRLASIQHEVGMRPQAMINYLRAAEGYAKNNELDKTLQIYNLLIMMNPNDLGLHEQMVTIAVRLKDFDAAIERLKWLVDARLDQDGLLAALDTVDKVASAAPNEIRLIEFKAELFASSEMPQEATQHLAKNIQRMLDQNNLQGAHFLIAKGAELVPEGEIWESLRNDIEEEMRQSGVFPVVDVDRDIDQPGDYEAEGTMSDWIPQMDDSVEEEEEEVPPEEEDHDKTPADAGIPEDTVDLREQMKSLHEKGLTVEKDDDKTPLA